MADKYESNADTLTSPIIGGFDIAPNNDADLLATTRAIMVTTAGNVAVTMKNGDAVTLPALQPGALYPFRVRRVSVSGTTATGIKGLF